MLTRLDLFRIWLNRVRRVMERSEGEILNLSTRKLERNRLSRIKRLRIRQFWNSLDSVILSTNLWTGLHLISKTI